jgi:hypothetical protein
MDVKDAIAEHLPVPDTDSKQEMWMAATIVSNLARSGSEWIFLGAVILLILFLLSLFIYRTSSYLFAVYWQRLRETGPHVKVFRWALAIALLSGVVGLAVMFGGEQEYSLEGLAIIANTFLALSLFTAIYDWWVSRPEVKQLPSLKGLTAEEVIKMHKTVSVDG